MALGDLDSAKNFEDIRKNQRTVQRLGEVSARRAGNQRARIAGTVTSGVGESVRRRLDRTRQLANSSADVQLGSQKNTQLHQVDLQARAAAFAKAADERRFKFQGDQAKKQQKGALIGGLIGGVSGIAGAALRRTPAGLAADTALTVAKR